MPASEGMRMTQYYVTENDIEIINKILSRGNEVRIKKDKDIVKICEESTKVAKKRVLFSNN